MSVLNIRKNKKKGGQREEKEREKQWKEKKGNFFSYQSPDFYAFHLVLPGEENQYRTSQNYHRE